ncbi:hypothetical protein MLD38_027750 [Melastoma candidum]|uniref:Uncharacterized protein n=1 Tax=Melastoma candidum TaxID=119954 RepID=A0ACB9P483_9MYRT|nr:hypothetical protein MLD38_027750 [Melastoma candidum]
MQDLFGSVRRSLVFRASPDAEDFASSPPIPSTSSSPTAAAGLVEKINHCIRKSIVFSNHATPPGKENAACSGIRWRKGELVGCGAFGRVYMGMNLDSGELLAVKQQINFELVYCSVCSENLFASLCVRLPVVDFKLGFNNQTTTSHQVPIAANSASKEKAQTHIKELEEEVKLLKNLSHPNIVRYLGTGREEESLNIFLEFVSGGSISSLLGKFGAFPETVIRTYTKQLLLGLEYLHKNGIMHRDIKGANILVDNRGCIKLADFGASKQVVELATVSVAKSMKGTPYWMAPEVILQTGHSFSADIWSVGCTVIEMATGKPPWSQQYREVAALFYIGTTKSHPPIPEHLSHELKDFLRQCLQKEPQMRPTASQLLQHQFVTGEQEARSILLAPSVVDKEIPHSSGVEAVDLKPGIWGTSKLDSVDHHANAFPAIPESSCPQRMRSSEDDMCQIGDRIGSICAMPDYWKSLNPVCEPSVDWNYKSDDHLELDQANIDANMNSHNFAPACTSMAMGEEAVDFSGRSLSEDDDELTESKIRAFLDEKAVELKKLQTPLYEEFYNSLNASSPGYVESICNDVTTNYLRLPPKSRSPNRGASGTPSAATERLPSTSPGSSNSKRTSNVHSTSGQSSPDAGSPQVNVLTGNPDDSTSDRQRIWKEELDQELERKREIMRQAGAGGKTSSPKDRGINRQRERTRFASPG